MSGSGVRERWRTVVRRLHRIERREVREFLQWLENPRNLIHLTVLVVVPLLLAAVTFVSNRVDLLPFVLFPPLASGTYALFADPEGRYASPAKFVAGLTVGGACGAFAHWLAIVTALGVEAGAPDVFRTVSPAAAALAVFLTGALTWALDVEEPAAFSSALLALVVPISGSVAHTLGLYVASVAVGSGIVAGAFHLWREEFYEQRARYLYQSTKGDDHVLVPMHGGRATASALLAARLAGAHDAGKIVLLDVVDDEALAAAERRLLESSAERGPHEDSTAFVERVERRAAADASARLERIADRIATEVDVPCEMMVAVGDDRAATVQDAARRANCDLVVAPYETSEGRLSPFVRDLFEGEVDVLVHRTTGRERWARVLVPVRGATDSAHAMLDFACRLVGAAGRIAVCHCIGDRDDRREAESMLADLAETVECDVETRVPRRQVEAFLEDAASSYDLVIIGASRDRSVASRFVSPPTFERIGDLDADVAILDRNFRY